LRKNGRISQNTQQRIRTRQPEIRSPANGKIDQKDLKPTKKNATGRGSYHIVRENELETGSAHDSQQKLESQGNRGPSNNGTKARMNKNLHLEDE